VKKSLTALAATLGVVLLGASGCPGGPQPTGQVMDVSRPPLAQSLGCGDRLWLIKVLDNDVVNDKKLSPEQKAAKVKKICVTPDVGGKYTIGGQYP
jgi:hypothetical protein